MALVESLRWSVLFRKEEMEWLSPSGILLLSLVSVINYREGRTSWGHVGIGFSEHHKRDGCLWKTPSLFRGHLGNVIFLRGPFLPNVIFKSMA